MKLNKSALSIAIIFNVINFLFWLNIKSMPNATSMIYLFIYPCFWIVTLVIVTILGYKYRATWFAKSLRLSTIITIFFCTPIPFLLSKAIGSPSIYQASTGFRTKDGYTLKDETWIYNTGELYVRKYWKADSPDCNDCDSTFFKADSDWVYLNQKKDTIKVDTYKNGKLLKERKK